MVWLLPASEIIISLFYISQRHHFEISAEFKMPQLKNWLYTQIKLEKQNNRNNPNTSTNKSKPLTNKEKKVEN